MKNTFNLLKLSNYLLTGLLLLSCCRSSVGGRPTMGAPVEETDSATGQQPEMYGPSAIPDEAPFHYVVQCTFTAEELRLVSGTREKGDIPLRVVPTNELFLAVYDKDTLIHYFSFADPLGRHAIAPQQGAQQPLEEGSGVLLFPRSLTGKYRHSTLAIGIYTVTAYMPDFAAHIQTATAIEAAVSEGKLEKKHPVGATMLRDFLDNL